MKRLLFFICIFLYFTALGCENKNTKRTTQEETGSESAETTPETTESRVKQHELYESKDPLPLDG